MPFVRSSAFGASFKRKRILKNVFFGVLILGFLLLLPVFFLKIRGASRNESRELRDFFEAGAFEAAYEQSARMLIKKPLDFFC